MKSLFKTFCGAALLCLYFTFVRTALTGVAVFVMLYLLLEKRYRWLAVAAVGAVGLLLTSATLQVSLPPINSLFTTSTIARMLFNTKAP